VTPPGAGGQAPVAHPLAGLVEALARPAPVAFLPELTTWQASDPDAAWRASAASGRAGGEVPWWAFPWAGGQALARHLLDAPALARGRRVLDLASGSGLVAIAAARCGAARVVATDVDPACAAAIPLNAALNGVALEVRIGDPLDAPVEGFDLVLAGDVFYEARLAARALAWLRALAAGGVEVLVGDPGRRHTPAAGLERVATYQVPVAEAVEGRAVLVTSVHRVLP
jgi:predicted nicotinamide N-methyase